MSKSKVYILLLLLAISATIFITKINYQISGANSQLISAPISKATTSAANSQLAPAPTSNAIKNKQPMKSAWEDFKKDKSLQSKLVIIVSKSQHTLSLYANNVLLKNYHIELGDGGLGDKQRLGDRKTPEGTLYVTEKSVLAPPSVALGTRWMRLSYPNIEDAQRGLKDGLISRNIYSKIVSAINNYQTPPQRTALGGGVGIHGGSRIEYGSDWTAGCVGLSNKDVEEFYNYVRVGTPVIIKK